MADQDLAERLAALEARVASLEAGPPKRDPASAPGGITVLVSPPRVPFGFAPVTAHHQEDTHG